MMHTNYYWSSSFIRSINCIACLLLFYKYINCKNIQIFVSLLLVLLFIYSSLCLLHTDQPAESNLICSEKYIFNNSYTSVNFKLLKCDLNREAPVAQTNILYDDNEFLILFSFLFIVQDYVLMKRNWKYMNMLSKIQTVN